MPSSLQKEIAQLKKEKDILKKKTMQLKKKQLLLEGKKKLEREIKSLKASPTRKRAKAILKRDAKKYGKLAWGGLKSLGKVVKKRLDDERAAQIRSEQRHRKRR